MVPKERYYYGDFRLWREGVGHVEAGRRSVTQVFEGVDQDYALVVPASPNALLEVAVRCLGAPNPASRTHKGLRALLMALRVALEARSARADPLVWVADDGTLEAVDGYVAPTVTAAGHGFVNGDVVLIRRAGAGLWSLADVSGVVAGVSFDVAPRAQTQLHAIQAGDEVLLVEAYWLGMAATAPEPVEPSEGGEGSWWARQVVYRFTGSGRYSYSRTAAVVGS